MIEGTRLVKDLKGMMEGFRRELARSKEEEKFERNVAFKCELLTRAIKGMYVFIWDNALGQQQRAQLEANHIYDAQKLYRLSRHREYPNAVTSLANSVYNSIPKTYIDSLQLMQQKMAQYSGERRILAHPRVTKANFMSYLEVVHKNDVAFLEPIGDLEVDDEGIGKAYRLFDE